LPTGFAGPVARNEGESSTRTRKGGTWLKTALVHAAWSAIKVKDGYLRAQYFRIKSRRGPKKAILAVAASMLTAIYYILRDGSTYEDLAGEHFVAPRDPNCGCQRRGVLLGRAMSRPFESLTCADLRALAGAARAGRLTPPYSLVALGRLLDPAIAGQALADLQALALPAEALGPALALLADEREAAAHERSGAELVWTGPELPGAQSRDTLVVVRELFSSAESSVLVSGFAVHQGKAVFEPLARRMAEVPSLRVRLFLNIARPPGSRDGESDVVRGFVAQFREGDWPNERPPEIYYDPRSLAPDFRDRAVLHAKCIVVDDRRAFVTSANLTAAAQEKNIEAGLLVGDGGLARALRMQFEALVAVGVFKAAYRPEG
jgi:hypothetical protein